MGISTQLAFVVFFAATPNRGSNSTNPELEDLRAEVRAMRAEIQSLRLALAELAELDRQHAQVIARALDAAPAKAVVGSNGNSLGNGNSVTDGNNRNNTNNGNIVAPSLASVERQPDPPRHDVETPAVKEKAKPQLTAVHEPKPERKGGGAVLNGRVDVPKGEPVAYVYVENLYGAPVKGETVVIEQAKKQFSPSWAVVQKGTTVSFPNLDNIYHNVFSRTPGSTFDLGLYNSSDSAKSYTFMEPGPVDLFCNIHPRMAANVLVVPNRYFVKVKADGTFQMTDVPAGKRKIVAWSPGSNLASDWVELGAGGSGEIALKLEPKSAVQHKNKEGRPYGSYE